MCGVWGGGGGGGGGGVYVIANVLGCTLITSTASGEA